MSAALFHAETVTEGGVARVVLAGELDISTRRELDGAIEEALMAQPAVLVIDLRQLTFLSSTGLHAFEDLAAAAPHAGYSVQFIPGGPRIQRVIELVGLDTTLRFWEAPAQR